MSRRILLIEDNQDMVHLLEFHLKDLHCEVDSAVDGSSGLEQTLSKPYNLIILDLMLPGIDGLEICRQLRAQPNYTPVLMLAAKSSEIDRVLGLEIGADDYLTKPFNIQELLARVKALFRRVDALSVRPTATPKDIIRHGDLPIDHEKRIVMLGNRPVELTAMEFDLLQGKNETDV